MGPNNFKIGTIFLDNNGPFHGKVICAAGRSFLVLLFFEFFFWFCDFGIGSFLSLFFLFLSACFFTKNSPVLLGFGGFFVPGKKGSKKKKSFGEERWCSLVGLLQRF